MARVQLVIPDDDRVRYGAEARREGVSFSEWLREAARERFERKRRTKPFEPSADLQALWRKCDELEGPEREPDWEEHLKVLDEEMSRGASGT